MSGMFSKRPPHQTAPSRPATLRDRDDLPAFVCLFQSGNVELAISSTASAPFAAGCVSRPRETYAALPAGRVDLARAQSPPSPHSRARSPCAARTAARRRYCEKPSGARCSTASITPSGPPSGSSSRSARSAAGAPARSARARDADARRSTSRSARQRASRMACEAPFDPTGYIGCAASPSSVTRPWVQRGSGSRSHIGYSQNSGVASISALASHIRHAEALHMRHQVLEAAAARPVLLVRRRAALADLHQHRPVGQAAVFARALADRIDHELGRHAAGDHHRTAGEEFRPVERAAPQHRAVPARRALVRIERARARYEWMPSAPISTSPLAVCHASRRDRRNRR